MSNDLFSSLYATTNALRAQSAALDITGRNMANVNNATYSRQRIIYGDKGSVDTPLGAQSLGIEAVGIQQMRDTLLDKQIVEETSNTAELDSQLKYLRQAQIALGQGLFKNSSSIDTIGSNTTLPAGIASSLDAFFNAWQSFATEPSSTVNKQQLLATTQDLVGKFHLADQRLADIGLSTPVVANTLTGQMDEDVKQVNSLLTTLADLNRQIGRVEIVNPGTAVDLRDQRQAKLEELAKYIDFTPVPQGAGQVGIQVNSGGGPVNLINLSVVGGSLARNGDQYEWTPTAGAAVQLNLSGGSLAGYQAVGATVQTYRDKLDDLADALVTQVNAAYTNGGANTNGNFFNPANTTAATISISAAITPTTVVAGDAGGPSGANVRALAVAAIANNTGFLNGTPAQSFTKIVTGVAQELASGEVRAEDQKSLSALLSAQRESYGGVSLDEETADMMRFQRAYQASAKMMSVIDELLSNVIETLS